MGLPSGLRWASCNIGAKMPSDLGLYFSWGNIEGHQEGSEYNFSQSVYNTTPAANIETDLSLSQDAARASLKAPWRMPTADDFRELIENCTYVWTTLNGVRGILLTSNVNGNTLFLPAAGIYSGTTLSYRGSYGYYWSATYSSDTEARCLYFNNASVNPQRNYERRNGFSIRAVCPPL